MIRQVKTFVRDDHTLVVDTTSGQRFVYRVPHTNGKPAQLTERQLAGAAHYSVTKKVVNVMKATAQHAAAGFPRATEEQIAARLAICKTCEHLVTHEDGRQECGKCGCGIKGVGEASSRLNKIAWADQRCPDSPPRWGAVLH